MPKFLIITADDFGLHTRVNEAVERASRYGVLSAASLMVGAPAAADAVRRARALPQLNVGLHVVLADGQSVLSHEQVPGLTDADGHMNSRMARNGIRYFAFAHLRRQIEAEVRAQFYAFVRTGLVLDHVNVHKHYHLHPTLLAILLRVGRDYGSPPVRVPDEPWWFARLARAYERGSGTGARDAAVKSGAGTVAGTVLLKPWVALMRLRLRRAGVFCNDSLLGIAASGAMTEIQLLAAIDHLPEGVTELYAHPAIDSAAPLTPAMGAYRHAAELSALLSPRVRDAIRASQTLVGGYRAAYRASCAREAPARPSAGPGEVNRRSHRAPR